MANQQSGNMIYADSLGPLTSDKSVRLGGVVITATAAAASFVLRDATVSALKLRFDLPAAGTEQFSFLTSHPIFPNGITVETITNCVATLILAGKA